MRTAKAVLCLLVSTLLAMPASAQVRAAASVVVSGVPRVALTVPLSFAAQPASLAGLGVSALSAPSAALAALPAPAALAAAPAAASVSEADPVSVAVERLAAPLLAQPAAAPASAAASISVRSHWENFWSGSIARGESEAAAAPMPSATMRVAAAAGFLAPTVQRIHAIVTHAPPLLEAAGVLAGAYVANRGFQKLLAKFASKKGLDLHQIAVIRLVSGVVLWTGAVSGALIVGGAPQATLTAALGAGGTILTLGLRDVLGNVIQGVNFLITRPFPIGAKVQVDDQAGTVSSASLTTVVIQKDDGSEIRIRHAALASKPVIVFGSYAPKTGFRLAVPAKPKFKGAVVAVFKSVDRRFLLAGAAFAALLAVPSFVPFLAAGWAATAVHAALAVSIAWLTSRVNRMLSAAVDELARANSWRPETAVMARLLVGAALWTLGGGAALRVLGVTWTALAASLGVTTLGIGLASNNFFGSFVQGAEVLFSKPFKVGDTIKVGAFSGVVEDMTLYHVVLKLDEGRHALVPYAVVRDATLVVTPGK